MPSHVTPCYPSWGLAVVATLGTREGTSLGGCAPWLQPCHPWWPYGSGSTPRVVPEGVGCSGCSHAPQDLGTHRGPARSGTGPPPRGADSGLAGWGWGFCQQIDRQKEGMIHVSGCGPRAKTGERFDVRMRAGRCGCCSGSCRELQRFPSLNRLCPRCLGVLAWPGGRKQLKQHEIRPMQ